MALPALIGREREIGLLEQAMHAARQGVGSCIVLAGEAGIGKSRLLAEQQSRAAAEGFAILEGRCSEQDVSFPYSLWIDTLRSFLAPKSVTEITGLLGALSSELVNLLPELSLLIPSIAPSHALEPPAEKRRLFESLARLNASLSADQPLVICLEDLHWSDEQSLEFLDFFVRRIAALPILIVATYRSEDASLVLEHHLVDLYREHLAEELALGPLSPTDVGRMAQTILKTERPTPREVLDLLMPLTEGIPFFVEEVTKTLADAGAWEKTLANPPVPRSVRDMVERRVEQLPQPSRRVLAFASIIGERFPLELLQDVTEQDEQRLLEMLEAMIAARLIIEESADQFAFRHALTHQAVYKTLMPHERRAMHRRVGESMERSAGTHRDAAAAELAHHFYQGGIWPKAIDYAQRAGEQAQALYAPREALAHFTLALDAAQQHNMDPSRSSLRGRAQAREVLGIFDGARADYETALESARQEKNHVDQWQSLIDLGALWQSRDLGRAGEYYQRALELARGLEDSSLLANTLNRVGNWHMNGGAAREALTHHREALALYRGREDRRGVAHTLDLLGLASYPLGEAIQGAAYLEQAIPILRELDDRQALVNTLTNLTLRAVMDTEVLGQIDFAQLAKASDEALQIARGFNWYEGEALALLQGALCLRQTGEYGQALERLSKAKPLVDEIQNRELLARLHLVYGHIFTGLMALNEAQRHFETGLRHLSELGSGLLIWGATAGLASVALLQHDLIRAQALLIPLLPSEYPEGQEPSPLRACWSVRAELELVDGRPGRALEIIERLLTVTPNLIQYGPYGVPRLSHLRGKALAALERMEEAVNHLRGALEIARAQGARPLLWRLYTDLGQIFQAMGKREEAKHEFFFARATIVDLASSLPDPGLRENFMKQALATMPPVSAPTPRQMAKNEYGGLTAREREIAVLIAQGKSNRDIASELVISESTAERHVANILSKLGFHSRTQIAAWVVAKGRGV